MQHAEAKVQGGVAHIPSLRPLLVWLAVAVVLMLAGGCSGAPAAAGAPEDARPSTAIPAHDPYPTAYPDAVPASDEVVLKWNGTLVLNGEARPIVRTSE